MTEQEKREKVINGLECCGKCNRYECNNCGYLCEDNCYSALCDDAVALLKEQERDLHDMKEDLDDTLKDNMRLAELLNTQEPRILTYEEAMLDTDCDVVWIEMKGPMPCIDDDGGMLEFKKEEFGKTWRPWSSVPTDEQREATPWN